jgi:cytochrome c
MRFHVLTKILPLMLVAALSACTDNGDSGGTGKTRKGVIGTSLDNFEIESLPGASLTRKQCGSCHSIESGFRKVGPSLKGIFGRAPRISGVPYAVWDEKSLDKWIENPNKVKPRTAMAIPGNKSAEERAAIIEYLKRI